MMVGVTRNLYNGRWIADSFIDSPKFIDSIDTCQLKSMLTSNLGPEVINSLSYIHKELCKMYTVQVQSSYFEDSKQIFF